MDKCQVPGCERDAAEEMDFDVEKMCAFHWDWEAACSVSEDEFNGHIFGWKVDEIMLDWGYEQAELDAERERLARA